MSARETSRDSDAIAGSSGAAHVDGGQAQHARDWTLVRSVLAADEPALEQFIARLHVLPRILTALNVRYGTVLASHDLADLCQETLLLVWRKLETFNGQSTIETWVYGIARFEFLNQLRRKRRELDRPTETAVEGASTRPDEDRLDVERVRRGLSKIDREGAEMIRLHHFEGLTIEAAAARLRIGLSTAKSRYYRGLARLEVLLRTEMQELRS